MSRKHVILAVIALLSVITFIDRNAISLAGQRITNELGLSESQFGWILGAFTISYGLFEIPTGRWGDRFGPRVTLARVVIWWSAFTMLTGLAGGFASLFVIRFLFGAGEAGAYPNSAIVVRRWFPPLERGGAQAIIWMASRIGGALTPFIVIPIQQTYGWRVSFYVLGFIGIVWALVWLGWYKEDHAHLAERKEARPVQWNRWVGNRSFWLLILMYYCYASGVFFFISWLPKFLQNGRGLSEADMVLPASLPFFLGAFGCLAGGWLSDFLVTKMGPEEGRRIVPLTGLVLSGISMLIAAYATDNTIAIAALGLGMAFMDVTAPVAWAVAIDMGGKDSGVVTGAMNTAGLLGGTVTSLGIGYLVSGFNSYTVPVVIVGIMLIAGGIMWLAIESKDEMVS